MLACVSKVGLVLGGGGITGAAFHFGTLLALEMATGWDANDSEVVVGTSSGAFAGAMVRGDALKLDSFAGTGETRDEIHKWLSANLYRRGAPRGGVRWLRRGLLPALRRPSLHVALASPGLYRTDGIEAWVRDAVGSLGDSWPLKPLALVAYDVERRVRVPFGTQGAPHVPLARAVAASSAVPFIYEPVRIDGRWYADGGLATGTSADLVLGHPEPLDLVVILAPLAAMQPRAGARFYEDVFDRAGHTALASEVRAIEAQWPNVEILVLRPGESVLEIARPNPMSVGAAIPTFLETLRSMRHELASGHVWDVLVDHLCTSQTISSHPRVKLR